MTFKEDFTEFNRSMMVLASVFGEEPDEHRIEIYYRALADLTIKQIIEATNMLVKTRTQSFGHKFPLPAEIREAAPEDMIGEYMCLQCSKTSRIWHKTNDSTHSACHAHKRMQMRALDDKRRAYLLMTPDPDKITDPDMKNFIEKTLGKLWPALPNKKAPG